MQIQNPHPLFPPLRSDRRGGGLTWALQGVRCSLFAFCLFTFVFSLGCARSVTQYVTYGSQAIVEVELRGAADINSNRYFMVLASNPKFKVPLPLPDNINFDEFLEPGTAPRVGSVESYYANYYSTWSGFIELDNSGYFLVKGPFGLGQAITREALSNPIPAGSKLNFTFRLDQIFGSSVPETIYFDVVSVPWPADSTKIPADHLISTNSYISKITGSTSPVVDAVEPAIADSADIIKCTVTIQ